jgi:KamA family protein
MSWKQYLTDALTGSDEFIAEISKAPDEEASYRLILDNFPMSVPKYYLSLADMTDPDDPIRKMCVPSLSESDMTGHFDTSGEGENTVITGTQHKYSPTALVLSTHNCAMYCRHCFRKRLVGLNDDEIAENLGKIADYIAAHEEITNVLISGGDAFVNSNENIESFLKAFSGIDHLDFIRFGTRAPVVLPRRIYEDQELLEILRKYNKLKKLHIVTQFNHPRELTQEAKRAIDSLHSSGCGIKNQTVLLRGVNDKAETLAELMRALTRFGITPYYVFQCRPVSGVGTQFQVPISEGVELVDRAKRSLNGPAKSFRYVLSHVTGKIEILGALPGGETLFKYHQNKYPEDASRLFTVRLKDGQAWLDGDL